MVSWQADGQDSRNSHTALLQQNTLDAGLRLLMLPRFSRPNRAAFPSSWTVLLINFSC